MTAAEFIRAALIVTRSIRRACRLTITMYGIVDDATLAACDREIERWRARGAA